MHILVCPVKVVEIAGHPGAKGWKPDVSEILCWQVLKYDGGVECVIGVTGIYAPDGVYPMDDSVWAETKKAAGIKVVAEASAAEMMATYTAFRGLDRLAPKTPEKEAADKKAWNDLLAEKRDDAAPVVLEISAPVDPVTEGKV